jgi:hypothetical protein
MSRIVNIVFSLICSLLAVRHSFAQQASIPLNRLWTLESERIALRSDSTKIHLAEKPYIGQKTIGSPELSWIECKKEFSKVGAKIFRDHAVDIRGEDYRIIIDPLFDVTVGRDVADTGGFQSANLMFNQRGIKLMGDIGSKLSFQSAFFETQTLAPDYIRRMHDETGVYPSYGRTKEFGERGYDFAMATSLITFAPTRSITLQMGQGRQFYGHGYRSILWGDASFVYPFAKASFELWNGKIRYSTMYAELRTLERLPKGEVPESLFKPKSASVHYLSIMPHPNVEIGIFESTIWNRYDSTGTHPPSAWAALPLVGMHSAAVGLDAEDNSMLGLNMRFSPGKKVKLYGQLAIDQWPSRRIGWQLGMQLYDIAIPGLHFQLEFNHTGDFLYASPYPLQSVSHVNQPLGHPGGSALNEQLLIINYRKQRWMAEARVNRMIQSGRPQGDFNANPNLIFMPFAAWGTGDLYHASGTLSWIVQPQTCTTLSMGITWRQEIVSQVTQPLFTAETRYIWVGLKSNILNHYSDF